MGKRVTIKDIAQQAGVSLGAVHCALNGKPGVGDETRKRILEIAKQCNYKPNSAAASLKRKTVRIAVAFPGLTENNRFYVSYLWAGLREYLKSMKDFNIEVVEIPFYENANNVFEELEAMYQSNDVQGLICAPGYMDEKSKVLLNKFHDRGIPITLVGEDLPQARRLCCVQPHHEVNGRIIAELLIREIPKGGSILICAGDLLVPSHYKVIFGMDSYIEERGANNKLYKVHSMQSKEETYLRIKRILEKNDDINACFAVTASSSVLLGKALLETGKAGSINAVGSDMFYENITYLKNGVFTNLLNKNPYLQSYTATKYFVEYLIRGNIPPSDTVYVSSEVVFQSSLPMYESDGRSRLFV